MLIGNLEIKLFLILPQCFNGIKQAPDDVYCIFSTKKILSSTSTIPILQ